MPLVMPLTVAHVAVQPLSAHAPGDGVDGQRSASGWTARLAKLTADRPPLVISSLGKEHAMSPFIMIDLVRVIDDERRRPARRHVRPFRRSAR